MQKLKEVFGIETRSTIIPITTTHNGENWDIQIDAVYGMCLYKIDSKRSIEFVVLNSCEFRSQKDTKILIKTNMAVYEFDVVFVNHVLDKESERIIVAKLLYNKQPVGHVYSIARTSILLDKNAISVVI